jgi:hypothetical protein
MASSEKILIMFALLCLLLGSFVFVGHDMWGIMVDMPQGLLYVASGLFAFAALMRGPDSVRRFCLSAGLIFSFIFLAGVFAAGRQGSVLQLFRVNGWENMIHLVFAVSLLVLSLGEQYLAQRFAPAKRI